VAVSRVEWVTRVVDEVDLAVEREKDAQRLSAALVVVADLRGVGAPDLRQVRHDIPGLVLIGERPAIGLVLAGISRASAAELEPGNVVGLYRVRIQVGKRLQA